MTTPPPAASHRLHDFVCTMCGCMCDDLTLQVESNRVVATSPPCPVAEKFLLAERPTPPAACLIDGAPAELDAALTRAADILRAAAAPLVMGFQRATVDAQRTAVEIADRLGGYLDPTDALGRSQSHTAIAAAGAVTATLGEVAARSDLVIYWFADPAPTSPRHIERFARAAGTARSADASAERRMIVVDASRTATAEAADEFLSVAPGGSVQALWTLRAVVRGISLDESQVLRQTGATLAAWEELAAKLKAAKYVAIFHEPLPRDAGGPDAQSQAVAELVRDLHRHTRAVALRMGGPGNAAGAAQVLTWQTGFPAAVSFTRGYPQYLPGEATAERLLERGEVDAALIVAADPLGRLSAAANAHLRSIPLIAIDHRDTETTQAAAVAMLTSVFGIHTAGSVYRSDGVALPLRAATTSPLPAAAHVLAQLAARL